MTFRSLLQFGRERTLEEFLHELTRTKAFRSPFDDERIEFLGLLSRKLSGLDKIEYPEIHALAFWLRPAALKQFKLLYANKLNPSTMTKPRGFVFHVVPSNVDTMFMYSWAISFLCGNSDLIKVSSRYGKAAETLLKSLEETLTECPAFQDSIAFVQYNNDSSVTDRISDQCDVRIIWGGDETINQIRKSPVGLRCKELAFSDRISLSLISISALEKLAEQDFKSLIHNFHKDAYSFQQMGCSSPKSVVWYGEKRQRDLTAKFWQMLSERLMVDQFQLEPAAYMSKMELVYREVSKDESVLVRQLSSGLTVLSYDRLDSLNSEHCGRGLFREYFVDDLNELAGALDARNQTISMLGVERDGLLSILENSRGIDRIVPIGEALNFKPVWDGYDLFSELVRYVQF